LVSDVGLISAVASIAEGFSVAASARYNTVSEGTTQETRCLKGPTTEETYDGQRKAAKISRWR